MTLFKKFDMEGNEAADRMAKARTDLDGRAMATMKAAPVTQELSGSTRSLAVCRNLPLPGGELA